MRPTGTLKSDAGYAQYMGIKNIHGAVTTAMARAGGLGFRVYADPAEQCLYFEMYKGTDRTESQDENARVTFSDVYFNIDRPRYEENEANYKNYAIVCGEGEGTDRTIVELDRTNGEDRRELLVDARDLFKEEGQTDAEYTAVLLQRGAEKLDEHNRIQSFEVGIKSSSQFRYKTDWDLGDIVSVKKKKWGLYMDQRVTEAKEVYEYGGGYVVPTFGSPLPEKIDWSDK